MEERNYIKEFIEAMKTDNGFNFLCTEGWNIRKDDLLSLLKELIYAVETASLLSSERKEIIGEMEENLIDYCE